jgi:hypothetical protein
VMQAATDPSDGGRCFRRPLPQSDADELAEAVAEQLLARWGVAFKDLLVRETFTVPGATCCGPSGGWGPPPRCPWDQCSTPECEDGLTRARASTLPVRG